MKVRPLQTEQDINQILKYSHEIYPESYTDLDLKREIEVLKIWIDPINNFSFVFENKRTVQGYMVVVGVNNHGWDYIHDPTIDDLDDLQLIGDKLYRPGIDKSIGFYTSILKKVDTELKGFSDIAYKALFKRYVREYQATGAKMLGLVGYMASPEMQHIAFEKQKRIELKQLPTYIMINPDGDTEAMTIENEQQMQELLSQNYQVRNRCRLATLRYPYDASPLWDMLDSIMNQDV